MFWHGAPFTTQSLYCAVVGAWAGRWIGYHVSF